MSKEQLRRALMHGFMDRQLPNAAQFAPLLIDNQRKYTMSRAISTELRTAESFVFSVAFITPAALNVLKQDLLDFRGKGTVITSNYLGFNSPAAYRELLNFPHLDVRIVDANMGFHAKGYVFKRDYETTAIVGSSNLTVSALSSNHEWNFRFSSAADGYVVDQLESAIKGQLEVARCIDHVWVDDYECTYVPQRPAGWLDRRALHQEQEPRAHPATHGTATWVLGSSDTQKPIVANRMQRQALESLAELRAKAKQSALVISATGTGKTILAALDVREVKPRRLLFLAHREQILDKAKAEFRRVLGESELLFGKLSGTSRDLGSQTKYLFGTTQSFSRAVDRGKIRPDAFDYVIIDEVHRAGASTYLRIIEYLQPDFLLGMTATPERTDGFNVFELFDYNLAFEIRLQQALEENMLVPFHYFGVMDYTTESGETSDEISDLRFLVSEERADHLVATLNRYGQAGVSPRGLIFCSRNAEAAKLSDLLNRRFVNGRRLRTTALSGADPVPHREAIVEDLEQGRLDYILSVDVFNEGIDIPSLNQIVMMRHTQSSIVFTQQLGRGLRKDPGKEYLVAIDFIGNYANNYLIPMALFGDSSRNKDSIRRKLIDTHTDNVIAGVSSISFDAISRQRVFDAIQTAKLDSMQSLKQAYDLLKNRLGRIPMLLDYARNETIDPVLIANKRANYAEFVQKVEPGANPCADLNTNDQQLLTMLTSEFLNGKRPQELLLLHELIAAQSPVTEIAYREMLQERHLDAGDRVLDCVKRILSLEWFTEAERNKYGAEPVVTFDGRCFQLAPRWRAAWLADSSFQRYANDVIATGLYLAEHRYDWSDTLTIGERYTRKDVCRLLNWQRNEQATMYGYKVDRESGTCPIFVTYHKAHDITESTRYGDRFIDQQTMLWYTRSKRTLQSREVQDILSGSAPTYLFVKKDDAEGTDFIYLGQTTPSNAMQTTMEGADGVPLPVVTMHLELPVPLDGATFDYFEQVN